MLRLLQRLFSSKRGSGAGERGERLAAEWLQRERGYAIVVRTGATRRDGGRKSNLVCRDREVLVLSR